MADFTLYLDCGPTADADRLQKELEDGLRKSGRVTSAETSKSAARFTGLELLAAITLAGSIVHQGTNIVNDVRTIVENLKVILKDVSALTQKLGVKKVSVPVGMEPKPIDELTDDDYQIIAKDIVEARRE